LGNQYFVDDDPWLNRIRGAGINIQYRVPSDRGLIESYIIIQTKNKAFFNNIKPNK